MKSVAAVRIAVRALTLNKMRSGLTMLGIIIGVGAVIAMVSIGNGAKAQIEAQIASLGNNVILVFAGSITSSGLRAGSGSSSTLTVSDAKAILSEIPTSRPSARRCARKRRLPPATRIGSREYSESRPCILKFANGR